MLACEFFGCEEGVELFLCEVGVLGEEGLDWLSCVECVFGEFGCLCVSDFVDEGCDDADVVVELLCEVFGVCSDVLDAVVVEGVDGLC